MLRRILIIFFLIIGAAFLFWSSFSLRAIFYETVSSVEGYVVENQIFVAVVFIILAALSALLSLFSSAPLVPIAIIIWGKFLTFVFILSGWLIGAILAYFVGYWAGYPLLNQFYSFEKIKYYKERLPKKIEFLLVLIFRISMPAEIPGYLFGIIRYHFGKYFLATFLSEMIFAVIVIYASEALVGNKPLIFMGWVIFAFAVLGSTLYLLHARLRTREIEKN